MVKKWLWMTLKMTLNDLKGLTSLTLTMCRSSVPSLKYLSLLVLKLFRKIVWQSEWVSDKENYRKVLLLIYHKTRTTIVHRSGVMIIQYFTNSIVNDLQRYQNDIKNTVSIFQNYTLEFSKVLIGKHKIWLQYLI